MRIAVLCPSFGEYGGIGRIAEALGREFVAAGHEIAIVCRHVVTCPPPPWDAAPQLALAMHQLPRRWRHVSRMLRLATSLRRSAPALHAFLDESRIDVVLVLGISSYAPWAALAARWRPVVVSLQGGEPDGRFTAHPVLFRLALRRAAAVAACASSLADEAVALDPRLRAKTTVVPNGVDLSRFAAAVPHAHERPYLFAAGRFTRQKGFDVLLEAVARVPAVRTGMVDLLLAGDGVEGDRLAAHARNLGLEGSVRFLGPVDSPRLARLYAGARIVVVPSRWEGLPLVCLEAMASARPVVATRVDGIPDAVIDQETGLLVPRGDADALARALMNLLADRPRAERLGAASRERARGRFAWPLVAAQYLAVLRQTVQSTPASP